MFEYLIKTSVINLKEFTVESVLVGNQIFLLDHKITVYFQWIQTIERDFVERRHIQWF